MRRFHTFLVAAASAAAIALSPLAVASGAPPPDDGNTTTTRDGGAERYDITLITGDRVQLTVTADGRQLVTVDPRTRADGTTPEFGQYEEDGHVYLVPTDVAPLVPEFLDRALFDLTTLSNEGHDDARTSSIPVIVTLDGDTRTTMRAVPALTPTRRLESADAAAAKVDKDQAHRLADALTAPGTRAQAADASPLPGVDKIWLDRQVVSFLDRSASQIGAPAGWQAGFAGKGVTVAVLDSGIDTTHPDLADVVVGQANFTDTDTPLDGAGHGSHVASTVAGSGAASNGSRKGIAYEANLLNGKVLDANGNGSMSGVIAGMEWAAKQGADVINMSLGVRGGYTDGSDPAALAVNALTDEYGTLFVISAGNEGGTGTITTPGTADKALTVGAVNRSNVLAGFSSRGPRARDFSIKPDLTAPGVDIVAARASGTDMGNPVNDRYTTMSGTSMAAPHVTGAAALLIQKYPDWTPEQITAALTSTSVPSRGTSVYQQGTGRVAVDRALSSSVFAATDSLSVGHFPYPQDNTAPVTQKLTYRNVSDQDVTLSLAVAVTDEKGTTPAPGMLDVAQDKVTVPAGGTAEVPITVNPKVGAYGLYGGWVHATDETSGTDLRTAVGFFKEAERYDITIRAIDRDGRLAGGISNVDVINLDDLSTFARGQIPLAGGTTTVRVPPGNYAVMGFLGETLGKDLTVAMRPEVSVKTDTTVVLDGRTAVPVEISTQRDTVPVDVVAKYHRVDARGQGIGHTYTTNARTRVFATPTDAVEIGDLEFYTKWTLQAPGDGPSPYLYDLLLPESGQVPDSLSYTIDESNTAAVNTAFHSHVPDQPMGETRAWYRPWETGSTAMVRQSIAPLNRTDYVSSGDTNWTQSVNAGSAGWSFYQLFRPFTAYHPGQTVDESWMKQVTRPAFPPESSKTGPPHRDGDWFLLTVPYWVDGSGHEGNVMAGDTTTFRLFEDGDLIAESPYAEGEFAVRKKSAQYRIEMDAARSQNWWTMSTRTSTAWTFRSAAPPAGQQQVLPLLEVGYDVPVDLLNRSTERGAQHINVSVAHQQGADPVAIGKVQVWASTDDGATWHEGSRVKAAGDGKFEVVLPANGRTKDGQFVSLRVAAADADGNTVEQEVIRAYRIR
ncbi:MAG TPA: S8 family serine peptidase [Actinomycetales bacterium]|nr:S8 family serine peptidase [Actinomycetales bacterium]